jgi:hypothetical protein
MAYRRVPVQTLVGAIIVLAGVALLANTTGAYDTGRLLRFVPSLFVLAGLYALVTGGLRNAVGPLVVVLVATAWQLAALGYATVDQIVAFWPVLVILFGLSVVLGRMRATAAESADDSVGLFAVFGGRDARTTSKTFVGGDVSVVFGGATVDLRDAAVATPPARLNVVALFGGVDVVVPRDWNVRLDVVPLLGAAEDERLRSDREHDEVDLVVDGFCAFGGVSLKD